MNELRFIVDIFDIVGEQTSSCSFASGRTAHQRYEQAIVSAECGNVGRINLIKRVPRAFGLEPHLIKVNGWIRPVSEPDVQTAGYIVHSARALDEGLQTALGGKIFHNTEHEAVTQARRLADTWSLGHEGLIVFKAIKHVQKIERLVSNVATRIRTPMSADTKAFREYWARVSVDMGNLEPWQYARLKRIARNAWCAGRRKLRSDNCVWPYF